MTKNESHLVGCPKEADPRNETCGCAAVRAERDARDATGRKAMRTVDRLAKSGELRVAMTGRAARDAAQRTSRPDPLATAVVLSLVDSIEGLLDAPAFANQETLVGDDVRAIELAKANAAAALKFFPPRPSSGEYRPTASGLNLALELVATAIAECGAEGVHPDELFEGFRRYGGSRELFDAMVKTLQSSTRALIVGGRLVAVDQPEPKLTPRSVELFLAYARDAGNWAGNPLVGGNVGGSKEDRGNLTQLKRAGLLNTFVSDGHTWVRFTDAGRAFARSRGVKISK